jgi:hypothetical protein
MLSLAVFGLFTSFSLVLFLNDWWRYKNVKNQMFERRYITGDSIAVFWCVISSVWAAGKLIIGLEANLEARIQLRKIFGAIHLKPEPDEVAP